MELEAINCPYCVSRGKTPDTTRNLFRNTEKGVHCFRCGAVGPPPDPNSFLPVEAKAAKLKVEQIDLFDFKIMNSESRCIYSYLRGRLPEQAIKEVRWSPQLPRRAVFPIYDKGKLVTVNARSIDDTQPTYITYGDRKHYVYRLDKVLGSPYVVFTEGPFDALNSPNGIATFGTGVSLEQKEAILKAAPPILFIALDPDAQEEQRGLVDYFSCNGLRVVGIRLVTDPADTGLVPMSCWIERFYEELRYNTITPLS
jgi:hypothetical protein